MIKLIHVISDTNVGGAGRWLLNYIKHYDRKRFELKVILPCGSQLIPLIEPFGTQIFEAPYMEDKSFDFRAVGYLKKILEREQPDILHTHASLSARVAGKAAKIRCIINTRHCIEAVPAGAGRFIKSLVNKRFSDYFVAVCEAVRENLIASGVPKERIRVVYNGVEPVRVLDDAEKERVRKQYGIDKDDVVLGIMARLEPVKGHRYLLYAVKNSKTERLKCVIAGTGSLENELKMLAKELEIEDKVIFAGYLQDTAGVLNIIDINVLSSESEAMSLSVLESMSVGVPTVATDVGGNAELIENGQNGLLVKSKEPDELAEAIDMLSSDRQRIKHFGETADKVYQEKFTAEKTAACLEEFYLEVLNK